MVTSTTVYLLWITFDAFLGLHVLQSVLEHLRLIVGVKTDLSVLVQSLLNDLQLADAVVLTIAQQLLVHIPVDLSFFLLPTLPLHQWLRFRSLFVHVPPFELVHLLQILTGPLLNTLFLFIIVAVVVLCLP